MTIDKLEPEGLADLEEAIRLAEVGEFLYNACCYNYGNGQTEPREYGIEWQWQQRKPGEYGEGQLLAASTKWHEDQAENGTVTEAAKLRQALPNQSTKCTSSDASAAVGVKKLTDDDIFGDLGAEIRRRNRVGADGEKGSITASCEYSAASLVIAALRSTGFDVVSVSTVEAPQPQAWAVAWRVRVNENGRIWYVYTERLPYTPGDHIKVLSEPEPLYAAPVPPQAVPAEVDRAAWRVILRPDDRSDDELILTFITKSELDAFCRDYRASQTGWSITDIHEYQARTAESAIRALTTNGGAK